MAVTIDYRGLVVDSTNPGLSVAGPIVSTFKTANSTVSSWFVDPKNASGVASDSNDGKSLTTPLASYATLKTMFDSGQVVTSSNAGYNSVVINVMSDGRVDDPLDIPFSLGINTSLIVRGATLTVTRTGSFTSASLLNRGVMGGGGGASPFVGTDTFFAGTWEKDSRISITAGAGSGSHAWIMKDVGGNSCRTTVWGKSGNPPSIAYAQSTPASGSSYQVETLPKVYVTSTVMKNDGHTAFQQNSFSFYDVEIAAGFLTSFFQPRGGVIDNITICDCKVTPAITPYNFITLNGCNIVNGIFASGGQSSFVVAGALQGPIQYIRNGATLSLDNDVYVNTTLNIDPGGLLAVGGAGFFDNAGTNIKLQASTLQVGRSNTLTFNQNPATIYGNGGTVGVAMNPSSKIMIFGSSAIALTGSSSEVTFMGSTLAYYFDFTNGVYAPTSGRAFSWTAWNTATGGGGFGNYAYNPLFNCSVTQI